MSSAQLLLGIRFFGMPTPRHMQLSAHVCSEVAGAVSRCLSPPVRQALLKFYNVWASSRSNFDASLTRVDSRCLTLASSSRPPPASLLCWRVACIWIALRALLYVPPRVVVLMKMASYMRILYTLFTGFAFVLAFPFAFSLFPFLFVFALFACCFIYYTYFFFGFLVARVFLFWQLNACGECRRWR